MDSKLLDLTKNSFIKKTVAILLIIVLTMFNFILLGNEMISYAADALNAETATNNKNVTFDVYFRDANGTISSVKEEKINSQDMKLFAKVSVKNDGYFVGDVSLESGNFSLKNEVLSSAINKIEGNTITLNQINSGETVEFEVGIEPVREENVNAGLLNMASVLSIKGIYRNIKEKDIEISAKREVRLSLSNPYDGNSGVVLNSTVITNKVYEINKRAKRVVQVLVESGLENNEYPIKETYIELSVPEKVEKVEVNSRGTIASNGKSEAEFNENDWEYNKEEQKIKILLKNEENNSSIKWMKDGKDYIVVTYTLDDGIDVSKTTINVNNRISLYDTNYTVKEGISSVVLAEEKDGIISGGIELADKSIAKGKIYSGEGKEYKTTTKIYINNSGIDNIVNVELSPSKFETATGDIMANAQYLNTVINKNDVLRILGENGILKVLDAGGQVIAQISNESEADENGNIVVNYPEGTTIAKIETTTPKVSGTIALNNTKIIKEDNNSRATKKTYTALKESMTGAEAKIELKETESITKLQLNRTSLSTLIENTGVEITGTLVTNNEVNDLYENPNIKFTLPSQVENVTELTVNLVYEDELQLLPASIINENGSKVINVNLSGKQTKYKEGNVEGATIIVKANMTLNKKATNSNETIKMICTNQNTGIRTEASQPIDVVSPRGMVTINSINDYGMSVIGEEETKTSKLELGTTAKESKVNIEVINNNEEAIKDVKILGEFPTQNETNTIKTNVGALEVSDTNAKVYYTEKSDATDDLNNSANGWKNEINDSAAVKKYLIEVENMEQSQDLTASYKLNIPEGLQYNEQAYEGYKVIYNNNNTTNEIAATKLGLSTGRGPELKANIKSKLGNKDITNGGEISQGEIIRYEIEIENTGTEAATNINVTSTLPEGLVFVEPKAEYIYEEGYYNEFPDKKEVTFNIENLAQQEKITKAFEAKITKNAQSGKEIQNKAVVKYGEATTETETIKNRIKNGNLNVVVKRALDLSIPNYRGGYIEYHVIVENISNETQKNVMVHVNLPEELKVTKTYLVDEQEEDFEYQNNMNIGNLEPGKSKIVYIIAEIGSLGNNDVKEIAISATAKSDQSSETQSNEYKEEIKDYKLNISLSANNESGYLKTDDIVEYTIKIQNTTNVDSTSVRIGDVIPEQLTVQSITVNGVEQDLGEENSDNNIMLSAEVPANSTVEAKIKAVVNYEEVRTEPVSISNVATLSDADEEIARSKEITHIIQADSHSAPGGGDNVTTKNLVSGIAWLDKDQNGERDNEDELLSGLNVKLVDPAGNIAKDSAGKELVATTNSNGLYMLNDVQPGQYLVVFEYDTSVYALTAYQKPGVPENKNSDAILKQITVNGVEGTYGVTDTINITENGAANIDIGLMKATKFDLELNKYISKIIVQTKKDTKTYTYNKATLAKAEIAAKQLQGANVIIEYEIEVKNTGEVAGYVKNVVDYMPSSLKFSSELNKDWYQSGTSLYNKSLANTKLEAGESKVMTLTLTKAMTEENTGLVNNKAEIAESYNEAGIPDIDSKAGNKAQKEDDIGSADVIIGVKTGAMITYVTLTLAIIMLIGVGAYFVNKKINKETNIEVDF